MLRLLTFSALIFFLSVNTVFAQFEPLVGIPGLTNQGDIGIAGFVNQALVLAITVGGLLAVVKISIAGFKYMFTDSVPFKQDAKEHITGALWGLGILLAGGLILVTINPNIQNLDVFKSAIPIKLTEGNFTAGKIAIPPRATFEEDEEDEAREHTESLDCPKGFTPYWENPENGKPYAECKNTWATDHSAQIFLPIGQPEWSGPNVTRAQRIAIMEAKAKEAYDLAAKCSSAPGFKSSNNEIGTIDLEKTPGILSRETYTYGSDFNRKVHTQKYGWNVVCSRVKED